MSNWQRSSRSFKIWCRTWSELEVAIGTRVSRVSRQKIGPLYVLPPLSLGLSPLYLLPLDFHHSPTLFGTCSWLPIPTPTIDYAFCLDFSMSPQHIGLQSKLQHPSCHAECWCIIRKIPGCKARRSPTCRKCWGQTCCLVTEGGDAGKGIEHLRMLWMCCMKCIEMFDVVAHDLHVVMA